MLALQDQKHDIQLAELKKKQLEDKLAEQDKMMQDLGKDRKLMDDKLQKSKI